MNFLKIAREDIKSIFKNRFIRVSIIAIIIVPLLYSLLYLYAFWDPYAKLEDVHIAVVNKDKGATLDGSKVNYGKDIEEELKGNHEIGWEITSEVNANDGLEGKGYYAKVVIPEDFSSKIIAAKEGAPKVAKIDFISNDKKNFLASQINSKVEQELNAKITKTISQNYVEVAFDSLYEAKDGLTQAADGSKQIYDGMNTLNEKVPTLAEGATKLSDGSSQLLDGQATLNNGIGSIINGANALNSGLGQVYEKVPTLSSGVSALANGTNELKSGTSEALAGSKQLADGNKNLYNAYIEKIYPSIGQLKAGANLLNSNLSNGQGGIVDLNKGVNELVKGVSDSTKANAMVQELLTKAASSETTVEEKNLLIQQALEITQKVQADASKNAPRIKELTDGVSNLTLSMKELSIGVSKLDVGLNGLYTNLDPQTSEFGVGLKSVSDGASNLNTGLTKLNAGANALNDGTSALKSNIPTLTSGISALYNGSNELANGSVKLQDGSSKLLDGQKSLNSGISELASKVPELTDGVKKLYDGSNELSTKLNEGADKMKDGLKNSSETMGEFVSEPINMNFDSINKIPNYGTGFAPYFIPLSLWIGAIMMFFVIPSKLKEEENLSKFDRVMAKYLSYAFVGILQAILVSIVVLILGLETSNPAAYIGTNIFLSLVFVSIIQCLISLLGDAGRLLGIVLLILQLTACAGTFPLEVVPKFFRVLNPYMPFTYAVEALREVISAEVINSSVVGKDFLILGVILVVFLAISVSLKNVGEKIAEKIEGRKSDIVA